jgi:drug/metabolite transporter (DMT)-like permease
MSAAAPIGPVTAYSLAAVLAWGASDFMGGYFTRRTNAFLFTAIVNCGGLAMTLVMLKASHASWPSARSAAWALVGGLSGGASLAIFYRALASGRMGLAAPVAAVLSAVIPTIFSMITEGLPGGVRIIGFIFAAVGLWLITRPEHGSTPEGIGLAFIAGIGFAGFYLGVRQAGDVSIVCIAMLTRLGGLIMTAPVALWQRKFSDKFSELTVANTTWAVIVGCIDSAGTIVFALASQSGRLDEAVVISSLYPAITVLLAALILKERFTRWRFVGLLAALAAVPLIAATR